MNWTPVTMQWPAEATAWMDEMSAAKDMATAQLDSGIDPGRASNHCSVGVR